MSNNGLTTAQGVVLVSISTTSSVLSLLGSGVIIYHSWRKAFATIWNNNNNNNYVNHSSVYHQLMVLLSALDMVVSLTTLLQPWLVPTEFGYLWSVGTTSSCSVMGFGMRFPLGVAVVNGALSLYFLVKICHNVTDERVRPLVVPVGAVAVVLPVAFGVSGLVTNSLNPLEILQICDFGPHPPGCDRDDTVECTKGGHYLVQDWVYTVCLVAATVVAVYSMARIFVHVRHRLRSSQRFSFSDSFRNTAHERLKQVSTTAILYTIAYLNGFVWSFVTRVTFDVIDLYERQGGEPSLYTLQLLAYCMFPLQGFLNAYIYIRPKLQRRRQRHPLEQRLQSLLHVVANRRSSYSLPEQRRNSQNKSSSKSVVHVGVESDGVEFDPRMLDSENGSFEPSMELDSSSCGPEDASTLGSTPTLSHDSQEDLDDENNDEEEEVKENVVSDCHG